MPGRLVPALKGPEWSDDMAAPPDGEPLELCEECGSPLVDGICGACGNGYREGSSPAGAAPLERDELSRVLGRNVGARAHGSYALSMQQEQGMGPLRKQISLMVEQFNASPEAKAAASLKLFQKVTAGDEAQGQVDCPLHAAGRDGRESGHFQINEPEPMAHPYLLFIHY